MTRIPLVGKSLCWRHGRLARSYICVGGGWSVFFFSSRRRHTRLQGDWSSDVCSSDLRRRGGRLASSRWRRIHPSGEVAELCGLSNRDLVATEREEHRRVGGGSRNISHRSEERRVGEEGRSRWSPYHLKKKNKRRVLAT